MDVLKTSIDNDDRVYRGIVEDNVDPQKVGRVKVRVVSLHGSKEDGIKTEHLPYAYVVQTGAGANSGSFIVPEIGAMVLVLFENGNHNSPLVIGTLYATNREKSAQFKTSEITNEHTNGRKGNPRQNDVPEDGQGDIASRVVYRSAKGTSITIYDQDDSEAVEVKDANGQVFRMSSPLTQGATRDNKQVEGNNPEGNLVNVSTIVLKNPFGQMLQILSNGKEGIITLLDEPNMQGIEINSALGYTRMFNKKGKNNGKGGCEVYVNDKYCALRTEKSEVVATQDGVGLNAQNITLSGSNVLVNGNSVGIKGDITLSGSIHLDGSTVSNSTIKAHFIHGTGNASVKHTNTVKMLEDESALVAYVNPKTKLDDKAETVLKETKVKMQGAKTAIDTAERLVGTMMKTVQTIGEASQSIGTLGDESAKIFADLATLNNADIASVGQALTQLANMDGAITVDSLSTILNVEGTEYIPQSDGKTVKVKNTRNGQLIYVDKKVADWMQGLRCVPNDKISSIAQTVYDGITSINNVNSQLQALSNLGNMNFADGLGQVTSLAYAFGSLPFVGKEFNQITSNLAQIQSLYNQIVVAKKLVDRSIEDIRGIEAPSKGNKETKKGAINRTLMQSKANADLAIKSISNIADAIGIVGDALNIPALKTVCKVVGSTMSTATKYLDIAGLSVEAVTGDVKSSLKLLTALGVWSKF